ncbi:MAG TPA: M23 family metallopeptidase [Bryobacteraceae bacterium]|nr:M23 family metallopeptidase [Bryobacteraceae bacterium]
MPEYKLREPSYMGGAGRSLIVVIAVVLLLGLCGALAYLWIRSTDPVVEVVGGFPRALGPSTPFRVRWANPHGIRRLTVTVEQKGASAAVAFQQVEPARRFGFRRTPMPPGEAAFSLDRNSVPQLAAGRAIVTIEVQSNDLRAQTARLRQELPVVLEKPKVTPTEKTVFLRRGGTGIVTFSVGGGWSSAGVRVGRFQFPSWPSKEGENVRVSLVSIPPEVDEDVAPVLYARNAIGDEATSSFPHQITKGKFRDRTLELSGKLMDKVLGELDPGAAGEAADRFARINSVMRRINDEALASLAAKSEGKQLWEGPFVLLPRGKAEALFADHRTYRYAGKLLNREWHLGIDMASVKNAPIPAANHGKVVHAGRLGIYGNCVVIDHGYGVLSVYGHMSQVGVQSGQAVKKGQEIGQSGMSGLAGGDHLHLGVMVGPAFVDPVEWTYQSWMDQTLGALPR